MAFLFYLVINLATLENVQRHPLSGTKPYSLTIYEGLLLWSNSYIRCILATLFTMLALLNVPFSCYVCFE